MKRKLKLLIVGIDGATFDFIDPLVEEGKLPNFRKLMEKGSYGILKSTIPPQSAPAWISFMTGRNPGKHGVLNFYTRDIRKYDSMFETMFVTSDMYSGTTFFDILSDKGYKLAVITLAMTYPPWDAHGIMISGYPCPDTDKVHYYGEGISFRADENLNFSAEYYGKTTEREIFYDSMEMAGRRTDLAIDLVEKNQMDCLILMMEVDRAQHDFRKYLDPELSKLQHQKKVREFKNAIYDTYINIDKQLEKLLALTGDETHVFVLSDHGGGRPPKRYFHTNAWLRENGFLTPRKGSAAKTDFLRGIYNRFFIPLKRRSKILFSIDKMLLNRKRLGKIYRENIDWQKTKAFRYDMEYPAEGIVINVKGVQECGTVDKAGGEYEDVRDAIIKGLNDLVDAENGHKAVNRCFKREEIYKGDFTKNFPDIVFIFNEGYGPGRNIAGKVMEDIPPEIVKNARSPHDEKGIFILCGSVFKNGEKINNAEIIDLAPTILYSMGLSVPEDMDGKILDVFDEKFREKNKVRFHSREGKKYKIRDKIVLSKKEEEDIKDKLKGLGYL